MKIDGCDMDKIGTVDSSDKTIAILGDRWWPQTAKQQGGKVSERNLCSIGSKNVMSTQMLEVSLQRVGTMLGLERDAYSMEKKTKASKESVRPLHTYPT